MTVQLSELGIGRLSGGNSRRFGMNEDKLYTCAPYRAPATTFSRRKMCWMLVENFKINSNWWTSLRELSDTLRNAQTRGLWSVWVTKYGVSLSSGSPVIIYQKYCTTWAQLSGYFREASWWLAGEWRHSWEWSNDSSWWFPENGVTHSQTQAQGNMCKHWIYVAMAKSHESIWCPGKSKMVTLKQTWMGWWKSCIETSLKNSFQTLEMLGFTVAGDKNMINVSKQNRPLEKFQRWEFGKFGRRFSVRTTCGRIKKKQKV